MKVTTQVIKQRARPPLSEAKYLNLSSLGIGAIEKLNHCPKLQVLDLSSNNIEEVEGISCCPQLWNINLGNNQISCLDELANFYALGTLDLSDNNLSWKGLAKIKNVIILDLQLHGNPMLEKDKYYRIHAIDCLPNIWMLDGRIVTSAERLQVQQFFCDSALSSHPVRRKTSDVSCIMGNGLKLNVNCIHGPRTSSLVKQFPVNEVQSAETDLRRMLYLSRNLETDINIVVTSKSGDPEQNALLPHSYLQDIIIHRHNDRERCNMLLLLLVASLEFHIPQALMTETLTATKLNLYASVDTSLLFTLKREFKIQLVSLLMSASKLDRDMQVEGSGGLYDGLYLCLYCVVSGLDRDKWKAKRKSVAFDRLRNRRVTLNSYLRPRTAPVGKTKRARVGQTVPSSHEHKTFISLREDHRMLLAAEVILLMNVIPSFYNLIEGEACIQTLLLTAVGSISITEWMLNMAKEGDFSVLQDEISCHLIRQIERIATNTKNKNALFPLNYQAMTESESEWKIILGSKNAYPKRPKSAILTSGEHLYSGRRRAPSGMQRLLNTREQKNVDPFRFERQTSPSSRVTLGSNILLGPQNMARVIAMPESNVALVQMDTVPAANGSVVIQSRNADDHYCYVDVAMLEADRQLGCWKPRGTVGDRITLQAAVQDKKRTSTMLSRTPDALLIDRDYHKQANVTESKSLKSLKMPSRSPTRNAGYPQAPCKSSEPAHSFIITRDDGGIESFEEQQNNTIASAKSLPPRPLSTVLRERLGLQLPSLFNDTWLESRSLNKKEDIVSTSPTGLAAQEKVIEVPGLQLGPPEWNHIGKVPTTDHETQYQNSPDMLSYSQNESMVDSSSAGICVVSDGKGEDWSSVHVELNEDKFQASSPKGTFAVSKDEDVFSDSEAKVEAVSSMTPRILDEAAKYKSQYCKRAVSARHPKQVQTFASQDRPVSAVERRQDIHGKSRFYRDDVGFERPDSATSFQFQQTEAWRSSASSPTHIDFNPGQMLGHQPKTPTWSTPPQRPTSPNPSTTSKKVVNGKTIRSKEEKVTNCDSQGIKLASNWLAQGKDLHEAYKQSRVYMSPRLPGYLDGVPGLHQKKGVPSSIPLTTSRVLHMNNVLIHHDCKRSKATVNTREHLTPGIVISSPVAYGRLSNASEVKKRVEP